MTHRVGPKGQVVILLKELRDEFNIGRVAKSASGETAIASPCVEQPPLPTAGTLRRRGLVDELERGRATDGRREDHL